jgi:hypothetical protein
MTISWPISSSAVVQQVIALIFARDGAYTVAACATKHK